MNPIIGSKVLTLRGHFPQNIFRGFGSPARKVGLHGDPTGVASGARQERTPDSSPSRRAGPNTAPGLPAAGGGEEDLFYIIFRGPAQTLHQGGAGWGRGLILPNPPGSSRGRFWGASYGSPNRALGRKLSDFAGFYIEFFINFDWGSGVLPMIRQNR